MDQDITIEEWKAEYIKQLDQFISYAKQKQQEDPTNYPLTMWGGDWDEQFHSYNGIDD